MDATVLLKHTLQQTWRLCRQRPALALMGLLAVAGSGGGSLTRLLVAQLAPPLPAAAGQIEALLLRAGSDTVGSLIWGALVFCLLLLAGWLLFVWAEAALIHAVLADAAGEPAALRHDLGRGRRWLGRFVVVDALVFLPLFLLLLLLLLLIGGALIAGVLAASRAERPEALLAALGAATLCLVPLLCLAAPLGLATTLFRGLAFRETAVSGRGARASIRAAWRLLRAEWPAFLLLAALLWGVQYLFRLGSVLVTTPLQLALLPAGGWGLGASLGVGGVLLLLEAGLHAVTAVAWTVGYLAIGGQRLTETD